MTHICRQPFKKLMLDIENTHLSQDDEKLLKQSCVGGVILFARNIESPEQVRHLTDQIRAICPDLLIAVDQEGGRVARLRQGFSPLPAMGKLGELFEQDPILALTLAFETGRLMASEVLSVGIDFSFAPVLDVNGISQVIGDRAFHSHPTVVTALSAEFIHGMKSVGMAATGKHFPGHGSVAPDSHIADAIDHRSFDEIFAWDMQPFIKNLPLLDAIMPAHVIFSQISKQPTGFSNQWLQTILRQQLKFNGVIFSDDLSMQAAHVAGTPYQRLCCALEAGCDMGLLCNDRQAAWLTVEKIMAESEPVSPEPQHLKKLSKMKANIPTWQGSLSKTAQQFTGWQSALEAVQTQFF